MREPKEQDSTSYDEAEQSRESLKIHQLGKGYATIAQILLQ